MQMVPDAAVLAFAVDVYDVVAYARDHHAPQSGRAIWNLPGITDTWEIDPTALRHVTNWVHAELAFQAAYGPPLSAEQRRILTAATRLRDALHKMEAS